MPRPKKTTARGRPKAKAQSKATAKKTTAKATSGDAILKLLKGVPSTKRPPNNPGVPEEVITHLNHELSELKEVLDGFAKHLRSLDRKRLNGVGIKKLGFIERAYELALENGEFLPHYLTLDRFGEDIEYFMDFRSLSPHYHPSSNDTGAKQKNQPKNKHCVTSKRLSMASMTANL